MLFNTPDARWVFWFNACVHDVGFLDKWNEEEPCDWDDRGERAHVESMVMKSSSPPKKFNI